MMQLNWSKVIHSADPWEPYYNGFFHKSKNCVLFFYEDNNALCALQQKEESADAIYTTGSGSILPLPAKWTVVNDGDDSFLFLDKDNVIHLSSLETVNDLPATLLAAYQKVRKSGAYYEEAPFVLNEYCISHKGNSSYKCTKNEQLIWEFRGQAYLYTDIRRWNNRVYFGTAGNGGYLYVLDIDTGEALTKIKTGGTSAIVQNDRFCYFLGNEKTAKLFCVDLSDGKVVQEISLPGKALSESVVQQIDNQIHAITFVYKGDYLKHAVWSCISLEHN